MLLRRPPSWRCEVDKITINQIRDLAMALPEAYFGHPSR